MDAATPEDELTRLDAESLARLAAQLRALAHPVRLEVLRTLARRDHCVCGDIVRGLPLAQSTVSEHLRVLAGAGLVASRPDGQRSCYRLDMDGMRALKAELDLFFSSLLADPPDRPTRDGD